MRGWQNSAHVAHYVLLPGIIPRLRVALSTPFMVLADLMAIMFGLVRLLPRYHPYLMAGASGSFGVLDVFRAGAAHLRFDRAHIDQVIMYGVMVVGWIAFWGMLATTILQAAFTPAWAEYGNMSNTTSGLMGEIYQYTATPHPEYDVALTMLDRVLGLTGDTPTGTFFGSRAGELCPGLRFGAATGCVPQPFPGPQHVALHALLGFYSFVFLAFAAILLAYFVAMLVFETTLTGVPFGSRFNRFWAPIRMVAAIGLLVPVPPSGLNTAQYIVLYTAKISSAFATNGWIYYNQFVDQAMNADAGMGGVGGNSAGNPIGMTRYTWDPLYGTTISDSSPLAAKINAPDVSDLVRFLHLVAACEYYYETNAGYTDVGENDATGTPKMNIQAYFVRTGKPAMPVYPEPNTDTADVTAQTYDQALAYFDNSNIRIVFGHHDENQYPTLTGNVNPLCGELVIPVTSIDDPSTEEIENPGAAVVHRLYYEYINWLLQKDRTPRQYMDGFASQMVELRGMLHPQRRTCLWDRDGDNIINVNGEGGGANMPELGNCHGEPPAAYLKMQVELFQDLFQTLVDDSNEELSAAANFRMDEDLLNGGWANAGSYYGKIAGLNGAFISAVMQAPYGARIPAALENMSSLVGASRTNIMDAGKFLNLDSFQKMPMRPRDLQAAKALEPVFAYLSKDNSLYYFIPDASGKVQAASGVYGYPAQRPKVESNAMVDAINAVLGTSFLFDFKDNSNTHPLAQLVALGRTMLEKSGDKLLTGTALSTLAGIVSVGNNDYASGLRATSAIFMAMASIFFLAGFTLYYILPFLPFIYFFFAMLSWVKAVFEALIGAPLWALVHLHPEGEGFATKKAMGGYYLLFEIAMRPIITVFALLAALGVFTASVYILNDLWDVAVGSVGTIERTEFGGAKGQQALETLRGPVDRFFFTISYILIVYMIANGCFQLIDKIPNSFMRWFGGGAKSFAAEAHKRDSPVKQFTANANIAIAYPAKEIMNSMDEWAYGGAQAAAHFADNPNKTDYFEFGPLARTIQSTLGRDRLTIAREIPEEMVDKQYAKTQELNGLQEQLEQARKRQDTLAARRLGDEIQEKQIEIAAADPENILKLIKDPNDPSVPGDVKSKIMASGDFEKMKLAYERATDAGVDAGAYIKESILRHKQKQGLSSAKKGDDE